MNPHSEAEFVILTCQLACLQDDLRIWKRYRTEAQLQFHSEHTGSSRASYFMVIFLKNKNMSFGFIRKSWVNNPMTL